MTRLTYFLLSFLPVIYLLISLIFCFLFRKNKTTFKEFIKYYWLLFVSFCILLIIGYIVIGLNIIVL